jgi:hypothetical protein
MLMVILLWLALAGLLGAAYVTRNNTGFGQDVWLLLGMALLLGLVGVLDLLGLLR